MMLKSHKSHQLSILLCDLNVRLAEGEVSEPWWWREKSAKKIMDMWAGSGLQRIKTISKGRHAKITNE